MTFSRAYNNGALLQCYALSKAIQKSGNECVVLDYYPEYFRNLYCITKKFSLKHPPLKTYWQHFKLRKLIKERNGNYEKFINDNLTLTETVTSIKEIEEKCPDADIFVTGSDQVWNYGCTYFDRVFFLDFDKARRSKRFSYAACLGFKKEKLKDEYVSEYKRRLSGYEKISLREASSVSMVEEMTGTKVRLDVDPTLLLDRYEWEKIADQSKEDKPYILIYYVQKTRKLQHYAKELVELYKEKGKDVKVICVPCNTDFEVLSGKNDKEFCFDQRPSIGPAQLIGFIKNAEFVLTNSFHGTVFSVIFQKQFLTMKIEDSGKLNVRVDEFLKQMDLSMRTIEKSEDLSKCFEEIQYKLIEKKLNDLRNDSTAYIESMGKS